MEEGQCALPWKRITLYILEQVSFQRYYYALQDVGNKDKHICPSSICGVIIKSCLNPQNSNLAENAIKVKLDTKF